MAKQRRAAGYVSSILAIALAVLPSVAQAQVTRGVTITVTVVDTTGGVIPNATVSLIGLESTTKAGAPPAATTNPSGQVTFAGLPPGRYSVQATFPGFDLGLLRDIRLSAAQNRRVIVLPFKAVSEAVTVGGGQDMASSRNGAQFGTTLTTEQVEALSDDPNDMERQLEELAGSDAIIRVDSFEGQQLPPKSQIKSIHVTRDQFAAEAYLPGSTFVDIVTQPGVGRLAGNGGYLMRAGALDGSSPFVGRRAPAESRSFNGTIGGTLIKERSDFSLSVYSQRQVSTPILNQSGTTAQLLSLRQPTESRSVNGIFNYALTRDQTLRLGVQDYAWNAQNQGIGVFDSPERASSSDSRFTSIRVQEAGPLGRRTFLNTRVMFNNGTSTDRSAVEEPTIIILDGRTTGGAQTRGSVRRRAVMLNSDLDYVRGIHSWRTGIQIQSVWMRSDATTNYLGTYTFADQAAFEAGQPILYTRNVGNPLVRYFDSWNAVYFQDDLRISKALTVSAGLRYSWQTHVNDKTSFNPRVGVTWSPFKSGRTSLRASVGVFNWFMEQQRVYEQTLRFDGQHQRQVLIRNPSYPDPGDATTLPPNIYLLGDYSLQQNLRYSLGIDQRLSPRLRVNVLYSYVHQFDFWSGRNLNAPVNGERPNPDFGNVIEALTNGEFRNHRVDVNGSLNLAAGAGGAARPFNWRRLNVNANVAFLHARNNSGGVFVVPASGTPETEWGPGPNERPYQVNLSIVSTQLRNLNANLSWLSTGGQPYNLTTGYDDNGDGLLNDRPDGIGRNTLRATGQSNLNLRLAYTLTRAGAGDVNVPGGPRRYRVTITMNAINLTNHSNYGGYSGVMTSPFFMSPAFVVNPRRVDVGMNVGF